MEYEEQETGYAPKHFTLDKSQIVTPMGSRALVMVDRDPSDNEDSPLILNPVRIGRPDVLKGEVIAVGPGRWSKKYKRRIPMDVQSGNRVHFRSTSGGGEHQVEGREMIFLNEDQILAVEC